MLEEKAEVKRKPSLFSRFGIWCSGASTEALYQCPTEWNKFIINGSIILMTAILSFVSGSYFLSFVFPEQGWKLPVAFGVIWAFLIFTLDRSIIVSIKKTDVFWQEFKQGFIRIVLAFFIGLVIATPIELKLFEKEIQAKMIEIQKAQTTVAHGQNEGIFAKDIERIDKELGDITEKEKEIRNRRDRLYEEFKAEAEGTGGTGKVGKGPVYTEKKEEFDKIDAEWRKLSTQLDSKRDEKETLIKKIDEMDNDDTGTISQVDGPEIRIKALYQLSGLHWFITLLFILIECLPVITKLMNKRGPYDEILECLEYEKLIEQKEIISRKNSEINELLKQAEEAAKLNVDIKSKIEKEKADATLRTNKKILDNLAKKQEELALMALGKWFEVEKTKVETTYIKAKPVLENIHWQANLKDEVYYFFNVSGELEYTENGETEKGFWKYTNSDKEIEIRLPSRQETFRQETYALNNFTANTLDLKNSNMNIKLKVL
jgi:hypothetical protein